MSKQISFKIDKEEYVLEFDRASIQEMESRGFRLNMLDDMPFTMVPLMVHGAFRKHHSTLSEAKIEKIIETIGGISETLLKGLSMMIVEQAQALIPSGEGNKENPIKLTLNFDLDE
ncbi:MAG: DUF5055 domain-containing protein [Eubacteriales bacterium]|nr:DUF5055 domain-containing protein [Eubacteriales bacterium]